MSSRWPAPASREPTGNLLLDSLPQAAREALLAEAEIAVLPRGHVLAEEGGPIRYLHFPTSGLITGTKHLSDGAAVEALSVGREGVVGFPLVLGPRGSLLRSAVLIPADFIRIPASAFRRAVARDGGLSRAVLLYADFVLRSLAQGIVCARIHGIEERLARWLLGAHDRVGSARLPVTHEFLAQALGTYRPTVSVAVRRLETAGAIRAQRGGLAILSRETLEEVACECYVAMRQNLHAYREGLTMRK